jgi:hypothetical protein
MVEYSAGYGIEFEAIWQWATRHCGLHNEDAAIVYLCFSRAVRQKEAEVIAINYLQHGPDQRCLVLLIMHNGTLGPSGGFILKINGVVERKEGCVERLAKCWLLGEGFQETDLQLVVVDNTDYF